MFPWLNALTFPEAKRRQPSLTLRNLDSRKESILCSVEVFKDIPGRRLLLTTPLQKRSTASIPSAAGSGDRKFSPSPVPSNSSAKSPRPCSSAGSSQPNSAREPLFAPPPEPKLSRTYRKGLETSSAMLEMFGGGASTVKSQPVKTETPVSIHSEATKTEETTTATAVTNPPTIITVPVPSAPNNEPVKNTIENHDAKYAEAMQRAKWETSDSQFNVVGGHSNPLAQPGPENFDEEEEAGCPAEELLRNPAVRRSNRCNRTGGGTAASENAENEATVDEEFISDEVGRKRRLAAQDDLGTKLMQLSNPGPELADEDEEAMSKGVAEGQTVAMAVGIPADTLAMCSSAAGKADKPNADESIAPADGRAELTAVTGDAFSESATTGARETPVAASGGSGGGNYTVDNSKANGTAANGSDSSSRGTIGDGTPIGASMVALNGNGSGNGSDGGAGGGGDKPIFIRGGSIVNDDSMFAADILIEDGIIKQVSPSLLPPENAEVIEASGQLVLPAGIDVHTEFSTPGSLDDFGSGTRAALAGGTTTVIDVVTPLPEETLVAALDKAKAHAGQRSVCNYAFSVVIAVWTDAVKAEMGILVREKGVNSFILDLFSDYDLFIAFEHAKKLGAHVRVLPENRDLAQLMEKKILASGVTGPEGYGQSRPPQLEADKIQHAATLSKLTNCPLSILSVSSAEASRALNQSRQDGSLINAEIPIGAIVASNAQTKPLTKIPIRDGSHHANAIVELLANNQLSVCVSDHCVPAPSAGTNFTRMTKGSTGVEERLMALWEKAVINGQLDPMRFVAVTSSNPAKTYNLYPRKGRIAVGADADIVVWNFKSGKRLSSKTHLSKATSSLFENLNVSAQASATICGGKLLYRDGKHVGAIPGKGAFLRLQPNSPFLFSVVSLRDTINAFSLTSINVESTPASSHAAGLTSGSVTHAGDDDRPITGSGARNKNTQQHEQLPAKRRKHPPGGQTSGIF
uniref:Amidohydro-rel domain-containing protein n=1 Tax=Panagrellus redivivus TaxID=6233 RepID=A0A7E4W352_PANRE